VTALARPSSNCTDKLQTCPLVREGAPQDDSKSTAKDKDGSGRRLFKVLPRCTPGGNEENYKSLSQTVGVPIRVRTEHLPNINKKVCCFGHLAGDMF
jgi:hypothetical protein